MKPGTIRYMIILLEQLTSVYGDDAIVNARNPAGDSDTADDAWCIKDATSYCGTSQIYIGRECDHDN